jgi:hypothetical protein
MSKVYVCSYRDEFHGRSRILSKEQSGFSLAG